MLGHGDIEMNCTYSCPKKSSSERNIEKIIVLVVCAIVEIWRRYCGDIEERVGGVCLSLNQGPFSEGGVPMQCVKSVELVPLGRQEVQSFIFLPAGL